MAPPTGPVGLTARGRILRRGDFGQIASANSREEARPADCVTGNAVLMHLKQYGIAIAVDPHLLQVLVWPGVSPLRHNVPRLKSQTRPVARVSRIDPAFIQAIGAERLGIQNRQQVSSGSFSVIFS